MARRGTGPNHRRRPCAEPDLALWPDRLGLPLRWRKPKRVFLNSRSDLWHDAVPDEFVAAVWTTMFWTSSDGRPGHWVDAGRHRGGAGSRAAHLPNSHQASRPDAWLGAPVGRSGSVCRLDRGGGGARSVRSRGRT
ncbi:DUF5131 family protein [Streptomyces actuosus]|uniref:DUF5131 family protein n=1 Tax=Streptomyces actuosus TaxID=1885 RepID=UPI0034D5031C